MKQRNMHRRILAMAEECESLASRAEDARTMQAVLSAAASLYDVAAEINDGREPSHDGVYRWVAKGTARAV